MGGTRRKFTFGFKTERYAASVVGSTRWAGNPMSH
jgi:hypothetical protein